MIATIALVLSFRKSANLTAAYGVAISGTMVITTLLAYFVVREQWRWSLFTAVLITMGFSVMDLGFFGSNIVKIVDGGWVPLLVGGSVYILMSTWKQGRALLEERIQAGTQPLNTFLNKVAKHHPTRVPGTAVFLTGRSDGMSAILLHHLKHNQVLHEQVVLLTVVVEDVPRAAPAKRVEVSKLGQGFFRVMVHFGFMENPNVPRALRTCKRFGLHVDMDTVTYYVGRQTPVPSDERSGMAAWQESVFAFMARNSADLASFYHLPSERVIELGIRVEL